jgi:CRP/FNR family cyclic AMP-dependent transcriptional regulator
MGGADRLGARALRRLTGPPARRCSAALRRRPPAADRPLIRGMGRAGRTRYAPSMPTSDRPSDLAALPSGPLGELFAGGRRVRLRPGTIVFAEGDTSNRVVLVVAGRLKVSSFSEEGRETVLGFRTRGDVLGELAAIDGEPHAATVTVTAPSEALVLQSDRFLAELRARPEVMLALLRAVVVRLRDADAKRAEFAALNTDARIAERLIELAAEAARADDGTASGPPTFPITQAELAGWVGCSREAANKALGRFADQGYVELGRGRVTILDLDGLRRVGA